VISSVVTLKTLADVRFTPNSDRLLRCHEVTLRAISDHGASNLRRFIDDLVDRPSGRQDTPGHSRRFWHFHPMSAFHLIATACLTAPERRECALRFRLRYRSERRL